MEWFYRPNKVPRYVSYERERPRGPGAPRPLVDGEGNVYGYDEGLSHLRARG